MNEPASWKCDKMIGVTLCSTSTYPVGGDMSFRFILTTHEPQKKSSRGTEEQQKRSLICVSEWSECVVKVTMDEVTGAQLIAEALKSQVCVVLSYASFLGSQSFSCIFWNSRAKGVFFIKKICPLVISHLVKNKRVYYYSLQHRLLYYWTWTVCQRFCACALELSKNAIQKLIRV